MNQKNQNEIERKIIENYQSDERMMILIYAQWCINEDLDPRAMYIETYPEQINNVALKDALALTVPKEESEPIDDQIVLNVLQLFGNDDLAFTVQSEIEKRENKR